MWESDLITTLQTSLADLGKKSILSVDKKERDISNLTICISEETRKRISAELASMRQKILTLSENDSDADRVYQCNIQLFPVSQKVKVEK